MDRRKSQNLDLKGSRVRHKNKAGGEDESEVPSKENKSELEARYCDRVQLNVFTFSMRSLIWGHHKMGMELPLPNFEIFYFLIA